MNLALFVHAQNQGAVRRVEVEADDIADLVGFKWWLFPRTGTQRYVWMGIGFGGQRLMVFPEEDLIAVFTGWEILKEPPPERELVGRILPAVRARACNGAAH